MTGPPRHFSHRTRCTDPGTPLHMPVSKTRKSIYIYTMRLSIYAAAFFADAFAKLALYTSPPATSHCSPHSSLNVSAETL